MVKSGPKWETVGHFRAGPEHNWDKKMLIGQYEGVVGEKSRVAFPKKFREVLGDKLIITLGYENSLILVSEKGWQAAL